MDCSGFLRGRLCTASVSACVACEHAGRQCLAGAAVGEETGPTPFATPCWRLLPHSKISSRERVPVRLHKAGCLSWQLWIHAPRPDRPHGQGTGSSSFLWLPGVMVPSACVQNGCPRKAASANVAGLGLHQWQRQLQLLRCCGVLQPWAVLAQDSAGLSRELGSSACFHHAEFCLQFAARPRLNLQLTVSVVRVLTLFVNSLKSAWRMITTMP